MIIYFDQIVGLYESSTQSLIIKTADEAQGTFTGFLYETKDLNGNLVSISGYYNYFNERHITTVEFQALGYYWTFEAYYKADHPAFAKLCATGSTATTHEGFVKNGYARV